jgi:hypothetical protein
MNAVNKKMRLLVALPIVAALSLIGNMSIASTASDNSMVLTDANLSNIGFLDFKTLLFSPGKGDNLAGIFDQIRFIGPESFKNTALTPKSLKKFKRGPSPIYPTKPMWRWDAKNTRTQGIDENGKPLSASSGLADAILSDIKDSIQNHGIEWAPTQSIGAETNAYLNAATQDVIDKIIRLENSTPEEIATLITLDRTEPVKKSLNFLPIAVFGLGLLIIGLIRRRSLTLIPVRLKTANPQACFHAIRHSPIRYVAKAA